MFDQLNRALDLYLDRDLSLLDSFEEVNSILEQNEDLRWKFNDLLPNELHVDKDKHISDLSETFQKVFKKVAKRESDLNNITQQLIGLVESCNSRISLKDFTNKLRSQKSALSLTIPPVMITEIIQICEDSQKELQSERYKELIRIFLF